MSFLFVLHYSTIFSHQESGFAFSAEKNEAVSDLSPALPHFLFV